MRERIREIVRKEFRQALREPRLRVMLFLPPILQLLVFGYAVNLDVENVRIAWMDEDHSPASRDLLAAFEGSGRFQIGAWPQSELEIQQLLDANKVQAVVRLLPGFAQDLARGRTTGVQVLVDGSNSNTASLIADYATEIVTTYGGSESAKQQNAKLLARGATTPVNFSGPNLTARTRLWFNPDLRSRDYFVPGVMVNIIMLVTLMLTSLAIVREKEIGTMEQLMVTPIRPIELMIGKTLPFAAVGVLDVFLVSAVALIVFRIPFHGSVALLVVAAVFYLFTTLGAGLFISTISQTQQQAMMSSFFFSLPAFMLSGFAFPLRSMPEAAQWLTYLNPLRYFMDIVRGIFLKGTGLTVLWPQMLALLVYGVTAMTLSALRFRKRLD